MWSTPSEKNVICSSENNVVYTIRKRMCGCTLSEKNVINTVRKECGLHSKKKNVVYTLRKECVAKFYNYCKCSFKYL